MLTKLVYTLLAIVILMQSGGMVMYYELQRISIQEEQEAAILNNKINNTSSLKLTEEEYRKVRLSKTEVLIKGKRYDIVTMTSTTDVVELQILEDDEEEDIIEKIKQLSGGGDNSLPTSLSSIQKYWDWISIRNNTFGLYYYDFLNHISPGYHTALHYEWSPNTKSPPPKAYYTSFPFNLIQG